MTLGTHGGGDFDFVEFDATFVCRDSANWKGKEGERVRKKLAPSLVHIIVFVSVVSIKLPGDW